MGKPAARLEDLLLTLPRHLIVPASTSTSNPTGQFPLTQSHLGISLTPTWVQLNLHASRVDTGVRGKKPGKEVVLQVRREGTLEATIRMLGEGLNAVRRGEVRWGDRVG